MTVDEFHRSSAVHGLRVVHVACHKTSTTYGSARLALSEESHRHAATFVTVRSGIVPQTCPYPFSTASGGSLPASHLTASTTEAFRRDCLAVLDRRDTRARSRRRDSRSRTSPALVRPTASMARCTTCRSTCSIVSPRSRLVTRWPIATRSPISSTDA